MNWQKDFRLQFSVGPRITKVFGDISEPSNFERTQLIVNLNTNYSISFVPNQRSNYTVNFSLNYLFRQELDSTLPEKSDDLLRASVIGQYLRYVSPRIAWFVRGNLDFDIKSVRDAGFFNTNSIRIGVDYRIY